MIKLSKEEKQRYSRHIILDQIGMEGQEKLKAAKVLVIGAGGLGCPVLQYIAAAGIGTIGIADFDTVDISNLQRQVLFQVGDVGKKKAMVARERLQALNPHVKFNIYLEGIHSENAMDMLSHYDFVIDGSDNFSTRYLVADACVLSKKALVFGSIFKFEGQLTVFNYKNGPTYRCLYPEAPEAGEVPNCSDIGVLGVLPGIMGAYMANEAIKMICGLGEVLSGKLLLMDSLAMQHHILTFTKTAQANISALASDYKSFCGEDEALQELSPEALKNIIANDSDFSLIDVRSVEEHQKANIGGLNIPLDDLPSRLHDLGENDLIFYCQTGIRSAKAIRICMAQEIPNELYHLKGGITRFNLEQD